MYELFSIGQQVIIITGGYGALGGSNAKYVASQGATAVILWRSTEKGNAWADDIKTGGNKASFFEAASEIYQN